MNPWTIAAISWTLIGKKKSAQDQTAQKRAAAIRAVRSSAAFKRHDRLGSTSMLTKNPMSLFVRGVIVVLLMFAFIFAVILYSYWVSAFHTSARMVH